MQSEDHRFAIQYVGSEFMVTPVLPPQQDALYSIEVGDKVLVIFKDESEKWQTNRALSSKDIHPNDDQPAAFGELIKNHYNL